MVDAVESLLDAQSVAMRATGVIKPSPLIRTIRLHNKSRVVHPLARGVAVPCGIGVVGKLPAIGPDYAPMLVTRVQDHHLEGRLKQLYGVQPMKIVTGKAGRIAKLVERVVCLRRRNRADS